MSSSGNNFGNGQFGGLPLGGGQGGQGSIPAKPQMPGQGGFGQQKPPMMGNRPMYATPFQGMQGGGMAQPMPQTGGAEPMYPQGGMMPTRQAPMQPPRPEDGSYGSDFLMRAMRGGYGQ